MSEFLVPVPDVMLKPDNQHCDRAALKKEKQKEYFKKWYNERIITEKRRVLCPCGVEISYMNACNHRKTKKHLKRMILKDQQEQTV